MLISTFWYKEYIIVIVWASQKSPLSIKKAMIMFKLVKFSTRIFPFKFIYLNPASRISETKMWGQLESEKKWDVSSSNINWTKPRTKCIVYFSSFSFDILSIQLYGITNYTNILIQSLSQDVRIIEEVIYCVSWRILLLHTPF